MALRWTVLVAFTVLLVRTRRMALRRTVLAGFPVLLVRAVLGGHSVLLLCLMTVDSLVGTALGAVLSLVVGWDPQWRA